MSAEKADRIMMNAKVYSVMLDGTEVRAEAVGVRDGIIVFIGSDEEAKEWIGENTIVTDCHGKSLIPGLADAHMHLSAAVSKFCSCDLTTIVPDPKKDTPDDVIRQIQEKLKAFADEHPEDKVIHGGGWDRIWFTGALQGIVRPFTRHDLDAVIPDRPAVISGFCGHVVMFNTKALEAAGLSKDTPEPEAGVLRREPDGMPDGYIQEPVLYGPLIAKIPGYMFDERQIRESILKAFDLFASKGYTLLSDCQQQPKGYRVLKELAGQGAFKARVFGCHNINDATRKADLAKAVQERTEYDVPDLFVSDTVKFFIDGSPAMIEPYTDTYCRDNNLPAGFREQLLWNEENMIDSMEEAAMAGFNIHCHCMGDYAVRRTIDGYENAQNKANDPNLRNIIAHCTYVDEEDKKRLGHSRIIASIQPGWFSDHPVSQPVQVEQYGEEKVRQCYPCRSLIDNGVVCAFGSDFAVNIPFGLAGIQTAVTRRFTKPEPTYAINKDLPAAMPEECISLREALKAHTINGAYQFHMENRTGSIEPGKSADLVLLDSDLEAVPVTDIQDIRVAETLFCGKTTYKCDQDPQQ